MARGNEADGSCFQQDERETHLARGMQFTSSMGVMSSTNGAANGAPSGGPGLPGGGFRFMPGSRPRTPGSPHRLNLKFLRRSIRLAKPYWFSDEKRKARWLLVLLLLLLVGYTEFAVLFNQQAGEFTSALAARDGARFRRSIFTFFCIIIVAVPADAYYYYVRDTLALNWRRWLTDHFLGRYFKNRAYYRLLSKPEIDNP